MELAPIGNVEVVKEACPPLESVTVARVAAPFLKVTEPVGIPIPGAVANTVALKVTLPPKYEGFKLDVSVVVVAALLTTWLTTADVDPDILLLPL